MTKKTVNRKNKTPFSKRNVSKLPKRSGVYEILGRSGKTQYVGTTNDVNRRLNEHKLKDEIPGTHFRVNFMPASEAEKKENEIIRRKKPKYNERKW